MKKSDIVDCSSSSAHDGQNDIQLFKFTGCAGLSASHSRSGWRRIELKPHCHKVKRGRTTSAFMQVAWQSASMPRLAQPGAGTDGRPMVSVDGAG